MKKYLVIDILVLCSALILAGCGSSTKNVTLNVTATDTGYDAATYTVPAGAQVTLKLTNNGTVEHEFAVLKAGEHVSLPFGDDDESKIYWELDGVDAGETLSGTFTAPTQPGEYDIVCGIPGHIEQGMHATLVVQ